MRISDWSSDVCSSDLAYSAWLNPPLPLNVIQGFITLQTPLYAVMSWLCIRAANARFLMRHAPRAKRPLTNPPLTSAEDLHRERSSGRHPRDHHDYTLKRQIGRAHV